jgi:hypothetical protein
LLLFFSCFTGSLTVIFLFCLIVLMKTCPYCKLVSFSRKQHVAHLIAAHPTEHHNNLVTCGTTQSVPASSHLPCSTQRTTAPSSNSSIGTQHIVNPTSDYQSLASSASLRPIPCSVPSATLEFVRNGCNTRICMSFADGTRFELVHLEYCPGHICQFPGPPADVDDRHKDWGCRGRVNNVACRGHPTWGTGLQFSELKKHPITLSPSSSCPIQDVEDLTGSNVSFSQSSLPIPPLRRDVSYSRTYSSSSSCSRPDLSFQNSWDTRYHEEVNDGWD